MTISALKLLAHAVRTTTVKTKPRSKRRKSSPDFYRYLKDLPTDAELRRTRQKTIALYRSKLRLVERLKKRLTNIDDPGIGIERFLTASIRRQYAIMRRMGLLPGTTLDPDMLVGSQRSVAIMLAGIVIATCRNKLIDMKALPAQDILKHVKLLDLPPDKPRSKPKRLPRLPDLPAEKPTRPVRSTRAYTIDPAEEDE